MKKYYCDGCEKEISEEERNENGLHILNLSRTTIMAVDLCAGCNGEIWEAINKVTHTKE